MGKVIKINVAKKRGEDISIPSQKRRIFSEVGNTGKRWIIEITILTAAVTYPISNIIGKISLLITIISMVIEIIRHGNEIMVPLFFFIMTIIFMILSTFCNSFLRKHQYGY